MIKINSLHKYFNRGKQNEIHVLNDISLDLPERGMVAIFGRSGCGKTTLLNVIGGLDSYLSGSVEIDGEKISSNSDALRNRHIGYIFQNYNLNTGATCFDNVADALRLCGMSDKKNADEIRNRTMSALSAVGMAQYARRYPDTLSGGQKQRIAIARAIVKSPDIILADEPTGNLDETNTVMIMDILREIAQTRLVLLVTHEANLVDSYCDRVIGVTDGRIISIKDNEISSGYAVKNKNHIYLGEFEKSSADAGSLCIDYYGDPAEGGVKLTIVNDGGKLFLRIDTPGIHIIDEYGETKLHDGVFEKTEQEQRQTHLDLSLLTPFNGKKYGKLFSFFSSFKSGSRILTGKKIRRGKKVLKTSNFLAASYLICFALVFTLLISYCASGISFYDNIANETNLNMFYIRSDIIDRETLSEAITKDGSCVDLAFTASYANTYGENIRIETGVFDTFVDHSNYEAYRARVKYLPHSLISDCKVISGSTDKLERNDVVLSRSAADAILSKGVYNYIASYEDLIGCNISYSYSYYGSGNEQMRIAAVVESGEYAAYADPFIIVTELSSGFSSLSIVPASMYNLDINSGEAYVGATIAVDYLPALGEEFKVNGIPLKATKVTDNTPSNYSYSEWISAKGLDTDSDGSYYEKLEKYYSHLREFAIQCQLSGYEEIWMINYFLFGYEDALYLAADGADALEYFAACKYREKNGALPTERFTENEMKEYKNAYDSIVRQCQNIDAYSNIAVYHPTVVFLSDEDYEKAVFSLGETHPVAYADYYYNEYQNGYDTNNYLVLHSTDPKATEAFLRAEFPDLPPNDPKTNYDAFVTPELIFETAMIDNKVTIIASLTALGVGLALMCVCIYFIMRSSMLSKVREIGIYRAVGVSNKNLLFKFAVESTAIALQTLVIGFAAGAYFANSLANGGVTSSNFYFPFWLGALTLALLIGTCILFGILPIAALLRKTPAQILAKYDI